MEEGKAGTSGPGKGVSVTTERGSSNRRAVRMAMQGNPGGDVWEAL